MHRRSLRSVNLNLLPILQSLLATQNVTRAAEHLNMSQSAVSEALSKLRLQFNDEILIKVGREMRPTPLALAIEDQLDAALMSIETLVQRDRFDPARLSRRFVVATADTVVLCLAPPLIDHLGAQAPNAFVQFVDVQGTSQKELQSGDIDMIIMPSGLLDTEDFQEASLYEETFVGIARQNHPLFEMDLSRKDFDSLPHISFRPDHRQELTFETSLVGEDQQDVIRLPHFTLLPAMVEESDAVAMIQKRAAEHYVSRYKIEIFDLPFDVPSVSIAGFWGRVHERDPAHQWFRSQMQQAASTISE